MRGVMASHLDINASHRRSPPRWHGRLFPLSLVVLTFAAFGKSVGFDFVSDDWLVIVHNPQFNPPTWSSIGWYWNHVAWNLYMPVTCSVWGAVARVAWLPQADAVGSHFHPALFHLT